MIEPLWFVHTSCSWGKTFASENKSTIIPEIIRSTKVRSSVWNLMKMYLSVQDSSYFCMLALIYEYHNINLKQPVRKMIPTHQVEIHVAFQLLAIRKKDLYSRLKKLYATTSVLFVGLCNGYLNDRKWKTTCIPSRDSNRWRKCITNMNL